MFHSCLLGVIFIKVGILFILIGKRASKKLASVRRTACSAEQMQEYFALADVDGKGSLTVVQFGELTKSLGLDLNRREVEAAFMELDYSNSGRLTYESIEMWWNQGADDEVFAEAVIS